MPDQDDNKDQNTKETQHQNVQPSETRADGRPQQQPGTDWQALARKWETRAKENFEKAQKFDQFEEAQKTEAQKLTDRAETAEREHRNAKTENDRLRVAIAKQLPADLVDRLRGDTKEDLEADADKLLALVAGRQQVSFEHGVRQVAGPNDMNTLIAGQLSRRR